MANKDGVLSIGIEYKSELNKMLSDIEGGLNNASKNNQLSKGMKQQFDNVIAEVRNFKGIINKELSNLSSEKVDKNAFKLFKQTVADNFKLVREDINRLDLAVSTLNSQIDIISNDIDLSKFSKEFKNAETYVTRTNEAIEQLINTLGEQGINLFSFNDSSISNLKRTIREIEKEIEKAKTATGDIAGKKFENKSDDELQKDLDSLASKLKNVMDLIEYTNKEMNNLGSDTVGFKTLQGQLSLYELQAARIVEIMNTLDDENTKRKNYNIISSEVNQDAYDNFIEKYSDELDTFITKADEAKKMMQSLNREFTKPSSVPKISNKLEPNSSELSTTITIETTSSQLWKKLSPILTDLQNILNSNPIVAPVKLVVAPTAVSNKSDTDSKISSNYSKKYAKVLAQTGEDAIIDLDGVYKKTFTSIMDAGVSYAKETILKIQSVFEKSPIDIKFNVSKEELDKIQNFILSNKDGNNIDISEQITKSKQEVKELNKNIENTSTLLQEIKSKGNIELGGFDKFTQDISKSIGKLEELQNILKALQNIEITLAKASGLSSVTEIETQWENLEKRIINATKLDGSFRKNISIDKIASEYQKYLDKGGDNSISNISKIKDNKDTIDAIIFKAKEFQKQDLTNDSIAKLSVDLDGVISKFDELITIIKSATNSLYAIIKQSSVSDLDKQWSSISNKFKSIADESGKINLSKQKKDIQELLGMYQNYVNMGGMKTPFNLTDNTETIAKLDKAYKKFNEVKAVDNSSIVKNESNSFKEVEESVESLTTAIGDTKVTAINIEATAMEDAAEREIIAIKTIVDNLELVVKKLSEIKGIKIPEIKIENVDVINTSNLLSGNKAFEINKITEATNNLAQAEEKLNFIEDKKSSHNYWQGRFKESILDMTKTNEELVKMRQYYSELEKEGLNYQNKISSYETVLSKYTDNSKYTDDFISRVNNQLNSLQKFDITNEEDIYRIKIIESEINTIISDSKLLENRLVKQDSKLVDIISKMKIYRASNTNMSKEQVKELTNLIISADQLNKSGQVSAESIENIKKSFSGIKAKVSEAGNEGLSVIDTISQRANDMNAKFFAQFFSFQDWIRYFREGFNTIRELDTALTEMRKVSDETINSLKNYQATTFDVGDSVGATSQTIQNSTADWMRLGESINEAAESAKTSNILLNVSEFENINDATKSLVSMSQAYQELDKIEIVDKLNNIGNNYSISTDELATGLQNAAAVLKTQGNDLNEAIALVTAGNAITQDASKTSSGIRTIALRIAGTEEAKDELQEIGEDVDDFIVRTSSKTQQIIKDYTAVASNAYQGVDVLDSNGNLRNTFNILLDIAKVYKEIQEEDKKFGTNRANALVEELAGKNRSNIASSILLNPELLENVYKTSQNSEGSAQAELDKYLDSIDGKMTQLENRAQEFWFKLIDSDSIKNGITLLTDFLEVATNIVDALGLLRTAGLIGGGILGAKNIGKYRISVRISNN